MIGNGELMIEGQAVAVTRQSSMLEALEQHVQQHNGEMPKPLHVHHRQSPSRRKLLNGLANRLKSANRRTQAPVPPPITSDNPLAQMDNKELTTVRPDSPDQAAASVHQASASGMCNA